MGAERESGRRIFVSPWPGASMGAEREPHTRFEVFLPRSQDPPPSAVERIWHMYVSSSEGGSYVWLMDLCMTQHKAQGPSWTSNESREEAGDKRERRRARQRAASCLSLSRYLAHKKQRPLRTLQ